MNAKEPPKLGFFIHRSSLIIPHLSGSLRITYSPDFHGLIDSFDRVLNSPIFCDTISFDFTTSARPADYE
jgi:hypothetical protein